MSSDVERNRNRVVCPDRNELRSVGNVAEGLTDRELVVQVKGAGHVTLEQFPLNVKTEGEEERVADNKNMEEEIHQKGRENRADIELLETGQMASERS